MSSTSASRAGRALSAKTERVTLYVLRRFLRWLSEVDLRKVDPQRLSSYRRVPGLAPKRSRGQPLKPASIDRHLIAIRDFFRSLYRRDLLLTNPARHLELSRRRHRGERPIFSEADIASFLDGIIPDTPVRERDRAFFELLYSSGLRNAEARGTDS